MTQDFRWTSAGDNHHTLAMPEYNQRPYRVDQKDPSMLVFNEDDLARVFWKEIIDRNDVSVTPVFGGSWDGMTLSLPPTESLGAYCVVEIPLRTIPASIGDPVYDGYTFRRVLITSDYGVSIVVPHLCGFGSPEPTEEDLLSFAFKQWQKDLHQRNKIQRHTNLDDTTKYVPKNHVKYKYAT